MELFKQVKGAVRQKNNGKQAADNREQLWGKPAGQPFKKRLYNIKNYHSAKPETEAGIKCNSALKIKCETGIVPHPVSGAPFHYVACCQLQQGCNCNYGDEHNQRSNTHLSKCNPFLPKTFQNNEQHQRSCSVYNAVRSEKDTPI